MSNLNGAVGEIGPTGPTGPTGPASPNNITNVENLGMTGSNVQIFDKKINDTFQFRSLRSSSLDLAENSDTVSINLQDFDVAGTYTYPSNISINNLGLITSINSNNNPKANLTTTNGIVYYNSGSLYTSPDLLYESGNISLTDGYLRIDRLVLNDMSPPAGTTGAGTIWSDLNDSNLYFTGSSESNRHCKLTHPISNSGDILYGDFSDGHYNYTNLSIGTQNQVLTVNSTGTAPEWTDQPVGDTGPTGPTVDGPIGATGPAGTGSGGYSDYICVHYTATSNQINARFNLFDQSHGGSPVVISSNGITGNLSTGEFTIGSDGLYKLDVSGMVKVGNSEVSLIINRNGSPIVSQVFDIASQYSNNNKPYWSHTYTHGFSSGDVISVSFDVTGSSQDHTTVYDATNITIVKINSDII